MLNAVKTILTFKEILILVFEESKQNFDFKTLLLKNVSDFYLINR